jgi:hypothetical protein
MASEAQLIREIKNEIDKGASPVHS